MYTFQRLLASKDVNVKPEPIQFRFPSYCVCLVKSAARGNATSNVNSPELDFTNVKSFDHTGCNNNKTYCEHVAGYPREHIDAMIDRHKISYVNMFDKEVFRTNRTDDGFVQSNSLTNLTDDESRNMAVSEAIRYGNTLL